MKKNCMKVLIVQLGRIGDSVLITPMIRAIAEALPKTEIYVLASPNAALVLQDNPHLKKVLIYRKNPFDLLGLLFRIRLQRFDWWVDPKDHRSSESGFLAVLAGAKKSIGYNDGRIGAFETGISSDQDNYELHVVQRNVQVLRTLGVPVQADSRPELFPDAALSKLIRAKYPPRDGRTVLINISAGNAGRHWLVEKWSEVVEYCLNRGDRVILTYKPDDIDMARDLEMRQPGILRFDSATIRELIALMPIIQLVITPDTSVVHIASAFNIPIVAMFPNVEWNLNKFKPLSDKTMVILPNGDAPIETIGVGEVTEALVAME